MSAAGEVCQGRPALCPRCEHDLIDDPAGPWCRNCRTAQTGARRHGRCPIPATTTGNTPRTKGLRLCRAHARRLVDRGGPDAVVRDA